VPPIVLRTTSNPPLVQLTDVFVASENLGLAERVSAALQQLAPTLRICLNRDEVCSAAQRSAVQCSAAQWCSRIPLWPIQRELSGGSR
jgi:hypothetical protein